jgi:exodeoxyribonuclease-3
LVPGRKERDIAAQLYSAKNLPNHIEYGCGIPDFDREGRCIRVDFDEVSVMSVYFPSGSSGDERQVLNTAF